MELITLFIIILFFCLGLYIHYLLIKAAVKAALSGQMKRTNVSLESYLQLQASLLIEIAKKQGVSEERINELTSSEAMDSTPKPKESWF